MKIFLTDEQIAERYPKLEPLMTTGQLKTALGALALTVGIGIGAAIVESDQQQQECEAIAGDPQTTVDQLNECK